eukprot:gene34304-42302_t
MPAGGGLARAQVGVDVGATEGVDRLLGVADQEQARKRPVRRRRHPDKVGGGIRRDLFADDDSGTYLTDAALLETLVRGKLDELAEGIRAEGWAWVEAVPHLSYAERQAFQNAPRQRREPTAREARRIASLQNRLDKIDAELEEAYDAEDGGKTEALESRREQVAGELQAVEDALQGYAPDVRAVAGAIVTTDRSGEAVIHRGLL